MRSPCPLPSCGCTPLTLPPTLVHHIAMLPAFACPSAPHSYDAAQEHYQHAHKLHLQLEGYASVLRLPAHVIEEAKMVLDQVRWGTPLYAGSTPR